MADKPSSEGVATLKFEDDTVIPFGHIDKRTGEFVGDYPVLRQPTLDDEIFPSTTRAQVPMVKISVTGSVEMTQETWAAYCAAGLEPGRIVTATLTGYLPDPHARWVKRSAQDPAGEKVIWWEREGAIKIKALDIGEIRLGGIYEDTE